MSVMTLTTMERATGDPHAQREWKLVFVTNMSLEQVIGDFVGYLQEHIQGVSRQEGHVEALYLKKYKC